MAEPEPPSGDLDAQVRRADPDRWLASRFVADEAARGALIGLYAYDYELVRAPRVTRDALMGEMRLTWWREAMEHLAEGRPPRRHPVIEALAVGGFDFAAMADLAQARMADLESGPFDSEAALLAYLDSTLGATAVLAARRLDPAASPGAVRAAARAYGLGRSGRLPEGLDRAAAVRAALAQAVSIPAAAFPAIAFAALARPYAAGRTPGEVEKRARMVWATLIGRV